MFFPYGVNLISAVYCSENGPKINITPYGKIFYYLTYRDKIENLECYIFEKKLWDGLSVFWK